MKTLLALWLVASAASVMAEDAWKPLGYVKEGVYFFRTANQTNIIELKDGRFRLWRHFTVSGGGLQNNLVAKPGPRFAESLRSGEYQTNGSTVTIVTSTRRESGTNEWLCAEFKGKVTLSSASARRALSENPTFVPVNLFEATDLKPEEILEEK